MIRRRDLLKQLPAAALGLAGAGLLGSRAVAADDQSIVIAWPSDVLNWDPISSGGNFGVPIHKSVFDMLQNLKPDLSFAPSIIQNQRWLDKEGKALEITLRDDVTFHNGDMLTSEDVRFTFFERAKADNTLAINGLWGKVAEVETPSATTAVFRFSTPFVTAPQIFATMPAYVMPKRYFEQVGGRDAFMQKPIGSGPYRLVDYQRDSRIVLEAYDKYWRGPPRIKRVTFLVIKDAHARIAAIQSGQVDLAHNLPVREVLRLGAVPNLVGVLHPLTSVFMIHMVNKGLYKDKNLRLAMHHAIDKQALSRAFFDGRSEPLSMWSAPGLPANDPTFKFEYSQALARDYLARSGFSASNPVKVEFVTVNGVYPNDFDMARAIVQMWKQVGIEANLSVVELNNYLELTRNDKMEAPSFWMWSNTPGDPEIFSGYILDPKKRFSVWKSDDIPPRLDPLLNEVDYDKRIRGYREFDRWAVEQGYAVPLIQNLATVVHTKRVGYVPYLNGEILPYEWSVS